MYLDKFRVLAIVGIYDALGNIEQYIQVRT